MFGDSVVDVKHCTDPRAGKISSTTWGYVAAGAIALVSSAAAFAVSVHNAAANKAALATWTGELHRPAHAFRPTQLGLGYDWLAFGGLAMAITALAIGLVRSRRETRKPTYTIGTAPGVDLALEHVARHALVAPQGDGFMFHGAPGMEAELVVGTISTPIVGAIEITPTAKIRARLGNATFLVSATDKPRAPAAPLFATDGRMLKYAGGSLAVHLGLWVLLQQIPQDGSGANIDLASIEDTSTHAQTTAQDTVPDKVEDADQNDDSAGKPSAGATAMGLEGAAGDPKTQSEHGGTRIKDNNTQPQLSRDQALAAARESGILGSSQLRESLSSLTGASDFSSGFDSVNSYGPEFGADGNGRGSFGMGRQGFGMGGGCTQEPCGLIGTGRYGTIGTGDGAGDGWGGHGGHGGLRNHKATPPTVSLGPPTGTGGLDKAIIKRYVKRQTDKISYCYEKQLLAHPGLAGDVMVQFVIQGDGSVKGANGKGMDPAVASCVSEVVGSISFPKPSDGGVVQVNYPFTFHATGA